MFVIWLKEMTIKYHQILSYDNRISHFVLVYKSSDEVADWRGVVIHDEVWMFSTSRSHVRVMT